MRCTKFVFVLMFSILTKSAVAQQGLPADKLQKIVEKAAQSNKIHGLSFAVKTDNGSWFGAAGDLEVNSPHFIASTTKLFTTAIILQLRAQNQLQLEQRLDRYFDSGFLQGLHVYRGREYAAEITIAQLLAHSSGLPDYFQDKAADGRSWEARLKSGDDFEWSFEQAMEQTRLMKPLFAPGTPKKAHYSDANFQLLGRIIELVSGMSYAEACMHYIIQPLQLQHTYLYSQPSDTLPAPLYYGPAVLNIPRAMTSFGADGGMVSTTADMLLFIEAFFTGQLFPEDYLAEMQDWRPIFFPLQSGMGIHRFKLPGLFNPLGKMPWFIGHSGLSGALAYYSPQKRMFIVGTVNQVAHPDQSFKLLLKLAKACL
ncbi:MAG: serine hydrolase domain-containing protein [Bacteroidia bacterium]